MFDWLIDLTYFVHPIINYPIFIKSASVFCIWKSMQVLQKSCIKIMACAIYTYSA